MDDEIHNTDGLHGPNRAANLYIEGLTQEKG